MPGQRLPLGTLQGGKDWRERQGHSPFPTPAGLFSANFLSIWEVALPHLPLPFLSHTQQPCSPPMTVAEAQDIWLKMLGLEACRVGALCPPPQGRWCHNPLRAATFGTGAGFCSWHQTQSLCSLGPIAPAMNGQKLRWRLRLPPANPDGYNKQPAPWDLPAAGFCCPTTKIESELILLSSVWAWRSLQHMDS